MKLSAKYSGMALAITAVDCAAYTPTPHHNVATTATGGGVFGSQRRNQYSIAPIFSNGNSKRCRHKRAINRRIILQSSASSSSATNSEHDEQEKNKGESPSSMSTYIRPYLKQLFLLCRPTNFPIVALFHVLGVHQAVQLWQSSSAAASSPLLLPLLQHPSILMVLLSLLLVTSTSMITNDYYDARNGVDTVEVSNSDGEENNTNNEHYHPLANGEVPFPVTKTFDSYLYAMLLLSSAFVPGVISRLFVLGGAIITYLYTVHLKPKTWIKNLSCAALVAMSPVTSGLAAWTVLCDGSFLKSIAAFGSVGTGATTVASGSSALPYHLIFKSPLAFLVVSLFAGIMSREILMDITDCEGDAKAGIETVPVRYGKPFAARVALGLSFTSGLSACGASLIPIFRSLVLEGTQPITSLLSKSSLALITTSRARKVILSLAGSGFLFLRTFSVWKTDGEDANLAERAIRESLVSVLLVLASFL